MGPGHSPGRSIRRRKMAEETVVRAWRPSPRRRALGFLIMVPLAAFTILAIVVGFVDDEPGWTPGLIVPLLVFNAIAVLVNVREGVRLTDAEVLVQTSFGRRKRVPRERAREIRAGRRLVQIVAADGSPFVTIDRGVYSDAQLLEMASVLGITIRGPRRPKRLGRLEDARRA